MIIRIQKKANYVSIDNAVLEDIELSWKARGVLTYLLSRPPNWQVQLADLIAKSKKDGRDSARAALKELELAGYIKKTHVRGAHGYLTNWEYVVYEQPQPPDASQQKKTRNCPKSDYPTLANPTLNKDVPETEIKRMSSDEESLRVVSNCVAERSPEKSPEPEFAATWQPDERSKQEKLKSLRPPDEYPSQREFERFLVDSELDSVIQHRGNLYGDLCDAKWHRWSNRGQKWLLIRDWRKFATGLEATIADGMGGNRNGFSFRRSNQLAKPAATR